MRFLVLAACALAGCAQLSGLDGLGVCDGASCVDATTDSTTSEAGSDASKPLDASTPDSGAGDGGGLTFFKGLPCKQPADCFGLPHDAAAPPSEGGVCCDDIPPVSSTCITDAGWHVAICAPASDCPTTVGVGCMPEQVRLCAFDSECVESGFDRCCTFPFDAGVLRLCATQSLAQLAGGTCP